MGGKGMGEEKMDRGLRPRKPDARQVASWLPPSCPPGFSYSLAAHSLARILLASLVAAPPR